MSFSIALSGLNAASADLSTTANNIANANTTGFKGSRAEFADLYTVSPAGLSRNAIGSGTRVAQVAQQFGQGNISSTGSSLDLAISGGGFFTLSDQGSMVYTRNGTFSTDRDGYVVNQAGQRLQVFPAAAGGGFNTASLQDLQLSASDNPPAATSEMTVQSNLPANAAVPATSPFDANDPTSYNHTTSVTIYDSLGASHAANLYFTKTAAANGWDLNVTVDGVAAGAAIPLQYSGSGALSTPASGIVTLPAVPLTNGADPLNMSLALGKSTQYGSNFGVSSIVQDGYASGRLSGIEVTQEGIVQARYTNGQASPLGQLAMADFANQQGLQQMGNSSWGETYSSGAVQRGKAGTSGLGLIQSGALEQSNVDLTAQLVNMITAQRNFQANAQMIQTSDTITQTIINIR